MPENLRYEGGPRSGRSDFDERLPVTMGDGAEGGIYHRTDAVEEGLRVYRWRRLSEAERAAIVRGDLRSSQP